MELLSGIRRDLALAVRSLAKARAFTFVCVLSLGIGMTPVIAIPYGMRMFTTPPGALNTAGLVEVVSAPEGPRRETNQWSYPDFVAFRDSNSGAALVGWANLDALVDLGPSLGGPTTAAAIFVSPDYFAVMEAPLSQGAGLRDTTDPIVVISHNFWQRRLGSSASAVGSVIAVNKIPHTVVGIAREQFRGHLNFHDIDLFLPLERHPFVLADAAVRFDRSQDWVRIHGRLSGVEIAQASGAVAAVATQLSKDHPATNENKSATVMPYHAMGALDASQLPIIWAIIQTLSILPLLVVCLNIAGMVQVRSAIRERELSIRQAIGANRGKLIQQLLAESVVLAAMGAALAALVLFNLAPLVAWLMDEPLPPPMREALRVDGVMILVCIGLCLATSVIFGWLPAARFSRPVIITALKDDAGFGSARVGRVHRVATALQVAIATPLLILSGMTLDRVRATATDDLGFDAELLYSAPVNLGAIESENAWVRLQGARDALASAAGVASVTITDGLPLDFRYRMTRVSTQADDGIAPKTAAAHVTRVGDGYFETTGISLLRGRAFGAEDSAGAEPVTIVSKPLAEQLFPGEDPLGKRLTFAVGEKTERTLTIVGVSSDFPTSQMSTSRAQLLLPLAQYRDVVRDSVEVDDDRGSSAQLMLVLRSAHGEPAVKMTTALENTIRELDRDFESSRIVTGAWLRKNSVNDFLTQSAVSGVVGGILLLLSALGIYGVVGLMVATRVREIAIRVALGASRRRVIGMVLRDVLKLVAPGVFIGILIAVAFVKLNGQDFGIALSMFEPVAYVAGSAVAVLIAILSGLAPARRAASVHPMIAMRSE